MSISKQHDLTVKDKDEIHEVAKLILVSSPGHEADYYARIVFKKLLEKQKQELEDTLHVTQFLPSFLENSLESNKKQITKPQDPGRRASIRHSSPKKQDVTKNKKVPDEKTE